MENNITKDTLSHFTYEIIERIVRFIIHLNEIEVQFYMDDKGKKTLIDNYKNTLYRQFTFILIGYKQCNENSPDIENLNKTFDVFKKILLTINELHTKHLSILPRPSEPKELTRFERVIHKQIVQLTNKKLKKNISISLNEEIGERVYGDNLYEYKDKLNRLFTEQEIINNFSYIETNLTTKETISNNSINITIPRIDASNTFRWPTLIHEMCHSLFPLVVFNKDNIENDFLDFFEADKDEIFDKYFYEMPVHQEKSILYKWLEECWCDLFACILIGPSLYFSQFMAFLNVEEEIAAPTHPPHAFRLDLIETIIKHRFSKLHQDLLEEKYISNCEHLTSFLQSDKGMSFREKSNFATIFNHFNLYFSTHFLSSKNEGGISQLRNNPKISTNLNKLVNKYVKIHPDVIFYLVSRLKDGLPIPSIKITKNKNLYEEFPTYVQEIFLASWITRFDVLIPKVLDLINNIDIKLIRENSIKSEYEEIRNIIVRHDQAILKSIQVSEWFDFLLEEKRRPEHIKIFTNHPIDKNQSGRGTLVDSEIKSLILQDELKVIPMIYIGQNSKKQSQIGTTSLDVRLGTSFQVFYPDQYGMVDYTQSNNSYDLNASSKRINLDFIEGITITPGQFLLGHSMEYLKLPDYICGNLEGRSSFARLGIEIHMTAGYIDPGFEGVITFEIYNAGPTTVKIYPGMRIGQIRFETNKIPYEPYSKKNVVKYKGLLEHKLSRQNKDFEVELIRKYNLKKMK